MKVENMVKGKLATSAGHKCIEWDKAIDEITRNVYSFNPTSPWPFAQDRLGVKFDGNKLPYELISPLFLERLAHSLQVGKDKYGARNWEKGLAWSRPFGACMRHLWAWFKGDGVDKDTGLSHLALAAANIMFLNHYEASSTGLDDRPRDE